MHSLNWMHFLYGPSLYVVSVQVGVTSETVIITAIYTMLLGPFTNDVTFAAKYVLVREACSLQE